MSTILILNGNIYTMDAAQPRAQALAIDTTSGRILAVGDNDEVRRVGGRHAELVDLRGKTLLPGFIDAHIHLTYAAYRSYYVNAGTCSSEDEVANLVRQRATQTPAGQWIQGGQWNKNVWPGEQFPTKASLDIAAPETSCSPGKQRWSPAMGKLAGSATSRYHSGDIRSLEWHHFKGQCGRTYRYFARRRRNLPGI